MEKKDLEMMLEKDKVGAIFLAIEVNDIDGSFPWTFGIGIDGDDEYSVPCGDYDTIKTGKGLVRFFKKELKRDMKEIVEKVFKYRTDPRISFLLNL